MKTYKFKPFLRMFLVSIFIVCCLNKPVYGCGIDETSKDNYEVQRVCNVLLEPLQPGKLTSDILELKCGIGSNLPEFDVNTTYYIASFYDDINYVTLLVNFFGSSTCSSSVSYGVGQVPSSLNNRFSSGSVYSGCNNLYVYDLANYAGDSASCFANCSSFGSLNDRVSSWRVTN